MCRDCIHIQYSDRHSHTHAHTHTHTHTHIHTHTHENRRANNDLRAILMDVYLQAVERQTLVQTDTPPVREQGREGENESKEEEEEAAVVRWQERKRAHKFRLSKKFQVCVCEVLESKCVLQ